MRSISYCDDGILYGENSRDFLTALQEVFDSNGTMVKVHSQKSG